MADEELEKAAEPQVVVLEAANGAGTSRQNDEPGEGDEWTLDDAIAPPEDLWMLMRLTAINATRRGIIDAISLNTVGLGASLEPSETHRAGGEHRLQEAEIMRTLDTLAERDWRLDAPGFLEQLVAVKTDEEGCGNGYLEVSRNKLTGQIDGFYHLPGHLMRRRKNRKGWIMGRREDPSSKQLFYDFGDKVQYDENGKATGKLRPGRNWATNEVIRFRLYTSESRDYGLPRDVALAADYAGDKKASEANLGFFEHSGAPPTVLFVQGTETEQGGRITFKVPEATVEKIAQTMKANPNGGNRVAIIPLPAGTQVQNEQLAQISQEDVSYTEYREANQNRQLSAFRMSPIWLSLDSGGRYTAEVERSITLEQVFDPDQRRYERRINKILRDLGYADFDFKFKRLAVEADAAHRESAEQLADSDNITVGEHRLAHGFPLFPEAAEGSEPSEKEAAEGVRPFGYNDRLLSEVAPEEPEEEPDEEGNGEAPHEAVPAAADQRGLKPGIGGRSRKRKPNDGQVSVSEPASRAALAKSGDHGEDLPEYVEAEAASLSAELAGALIAPNGNGGAPEDPPDDGD